MMWHWVTSSRRLSTVACIALLLGAEQSPGGNRSRTVAGSVEITNSKEPGVRHKDYSGVVIWLEPVDRAVSPGPPKHVKMIQEDRHFKPHVLAISVGSTVDFPNLDPIYHNAFSNFSGDQFDLALYPPGTSRNHEFKRAGIVRVFCNIHPTMSAIIAVIPSPWYDVSKPSGAFQINNVPPGEYQLRIFYERALPDNLKFLEHRIMVPETGLTLPLISVSETGYIPLPHLNKYGKEYPKLPNDGSYPGAQK